MDSWRRSNRTETKIITMTKLIRTEAVISTIITIEAVGIDITTPTDKDPTKVSADTTIDTPVEVAHLTQQLIRKREDAEGDITKIGVTKGVLIEGVAIGAPLTKTRLTEINIRKIVQEIQKKLGRKPQIQTPKINHNYNKMDLPI